MFLVMLAAPNRENVHANHLAVRKFTSALEDSQLVTPRQTDSRATPTLEASMLNRYVQSAHMPMPPTKSLRKRLADPARCAPVPARLGAIGCRLQSNVGVWQELVS